MFVFIKHNLANSKNMPNLDGTGPKGEGPKTGRGQGRCGKNTNATSSQRRNRGVNKGRGFGNSIGAGNDSGRRNN